MKRRTEITIETHRVFVVRTRTGLPAAWCRECEDLVEMFTPEAAATLAGLSSRAVYRLVETESVHFTETHDGALLICLKSLHRSIPEMAKHSIT